MLTDAPHDKQAVGQGHASEPSQLQARHAWGAVDLTIAPPALRPRIEDIIERVAREHGVTVEDVCAPWSNSRNKAADAARSDAIALSAALKHGTRRAATISKLCAIFGRSRMSFWHLEKQSPYFVQRHRAR